MLNTSDKHIILRTFVGTKEINFIQDNKKFVDEPYSINQFNLYDLSKLFFENGFDFHCIKDKATKSEPYELWKNSNIFRQVYILVGSRH